MLPYCETLLQIQPYCRVERDSHLLCKAHSTSAEPDRHTHPCHPGCTTQHQGPRIRYVQCTLMGRHLLSVKTQLQASWPLQKDILRSVPVVCQFIIHPHPSFSNYHTSTSMGYRPHTLGMASPLQFMSSEDSQLLTMRHLLPLSIWKL